MRSLSSLFNFRTYQNVQKQQISMELPFLSTWALMLVPSCEPQNALKCLCSSSISCMQEGQFQSKKPRTSPKTTQTKGTSNTSRKTSEVLDNPVRKRDHHGATKLWPQGSLKGKAVETAETKKVWTQIKAGKRSIDLDEPPKKSLQPCPKP